MNRAFFFFFFVWAVPQQALTDLEPPSSRGATVPPNFPRLNVLAGTATVLPGRLLLSRRQLPRCLMRSLGCCSNQDVFRVCSNSARGRGSKLTPPLESLSSHAHTLSAAQHAQRVRVV
jgi:hypothetical protein